MCDMEDVCIRKMEVHEYPLLKDFLYEAIFVSKDDVAPARSILLQPELKLYYEGFGEKREDVCFVAVMENHIIGACWIRCMKDYGYVDDTTPSLAMSLYKAYRSKHIGTKLMHAMLGYAKENSIAQLSLSVQKENYAYNMYKKLGFQIVEEKEDEYIMIYNVEKGKI